MSILNLRSEDPEPEPTEVSALDETPPGLDAIRAWLTKPRPWVRGIRLWLRWIARQLRRGFAWTASNAIPVAGRAVRLASRGADVARDVARTGTTTAQIGRRLAVIGRIWREAGGRTGLVGARLAATAGRFRDFSTRVVRTASHGAAIGDGISDLGRVLGDLRETSPAPAQEVEAPRPVGRIPPRRQTARPEALPEPAPEPVVRPSPEPTVADVADRGEALPESSAAPAPAPASDRRSAALEELPWHLQKRIGALRPKTRKTVLWPLIVDIIKERGWTTSADLALLLGVGVRNLTRRHLVPLVEAGVLERRYPERATHPEQAYRVKVSPPGEGTGAAGLS